MLHRKSSGRRMALNAGIVLLGVFVLAMACKTAWEVLHPTSLIGFSPDPVFGVTLVNDTDATVYVEVKCYAPDATCDFGPGEMVAPGSTTILNAVAGGPVLYRMVDGRGDVLGCLDLRFDELRDDVVLKASQVSRCPNVGRS